MRRLDTTSAYSKRAYFFAIITFICFLIKGGLVSVQRMTETKIPDLLLWSIATLYLLTGLFTVFNSIKGIKEPNTSKKFIAIGIALFFIVHIIKTSF